MGRKVGQKVTVAVESRAIVPFPSCPVRTTPELNALNCDFLEHVTFFYSLVLYCFVVSVLGMACDR
jgi:hypothetical protein